MPDLPPLEAEFLPPGLRARFVPGINGLRIHMLEAGFETPRPALHPVAARLPRTRLVLAQAHAPARRRRLPRRRPRSARLWPHHRLGHRLRPRPALIPPVERRSRRTGPGLGARLPLGRRGCRPRFRLPRRRVVRAGAPRRVLLCRPDERAVRRPPCPAVRHRTRRPCSTRAGARHPRRPRATGPAAQALPMVLLDAAGQRRHVALSARRARFPARLLPPQKRRLAAEPALQTARLDRRGTGQDADLLHHGSARGHADHGGP